MSSGLTGWLVSMISDRHRAPRNDSAALGVPLQRRRNARHRVRVRGRDLHAQRRQSRRVDRQLPGDGQRPRHQRDGDDWQREPLAAAQQRSLSAVSSRLRPPEASRSVATYGRTSVRTSTTTPLSRTSDPSARPTRRQSLRRSASTWKSRSRAWFSQRAKPRCARSTRKPSSTLQDMGIEQVREVQNEVFQQNKDQAWTSSSRGRRSRLVACGPARM